MALSFSLLSQLPTHRITRNTTRAHTASRITSRDLTHAGRPGAGPRPRRRRRRRPTRAARPARATRTAPRAASSSAVSATFSTARMASRPAWPRQRRLRRTRPRTRAASRAKKTRTVTGTAASSGTRALSAAPVAPATVPSGTRRLRRPSTLLFLPARDPTSPRPLSSNLHQF